jgi:hypothetical protein
MTEKNKKTTSFFTRRKIILTIFVLVTLFIISGITLSVRTKTQIHKIFKLNQQRKSEGYYLSEFEFQMLGTAYYLDHGHYIKALSSLNKIHKKLKTTDGLIKIPEFSNNQEKLEFYKNLQNPQTGAFMDESYPLFTCFGVTANMIEFLEDLSVQTKKPFGLKYPLKFLDRINTPEKLTVLLDDLSTVGWFGSKFKTPYVEIGELGSLVKEVERLGIYSFTPEWKQAYLQWCYDNQDEETGIWGPRSRSNNKLLNGGDLLDSEKIISKFIDSDGNEMYPDFPLRYRDKMFATAIKKISTPMPDDLDELHDWILTKDRGIRFLTRYLWKNASVKEKEAARKCIEDLVKMRFENYYIREEGAFSFYPHAEHADLDGTGEALGMYKNAGALSWGKQNKLWGDSRDSVINLGKYEVLDITDRDFGLITHYSVINSIRLYRIDPDSNYIKNVETVYYPEDTTVPDLVDLLPGLESWVKHTPQNMGNWVTKENILGTLSDLPFESVPISNKIPLEKANEILQNHGELVIIGFDVLQLPRYKIVFSHT